MWRVVALFALLGCMGPDPIPFADYPNALESASCAYEVRCDEFGSLQDCDQYWSWFGDIEGSTRAAIEAGFVMYDGAAAAECLASYADRACVLGASIDAACYDVFRGAIADGGTCAQSIECTSGYCEIASCDQGCCSGTCAEDERQLHVEGEPCHFDTDCARGLYCPAAYGSLDATCRRYPAHGEACISVWSPCGELADRCDRTHTCTTPGLGGDPCIDDFDCEEMYACGFDNRCELHAVARHVGAGCDQDQQCLTGHCDGVCVDPYVCF